jgi:hypothetical protein
MDDTQQVKAQPIAVFEDSSSGEMLSPESEPVTMDRNRFAELKANGLVREAGDASTGTEDEGRTVRTPTGRSAQAARNKAAQTATNMAAPSPANAGSAMTTATTTTGATPPVAEG